MSLRATAAPNPPELVRAWRDSGRLTSERIGWCLDRAADQWPARGAVVAGGTTHSFADLRTRANAVARALVAGGVGHGDVVTWMLPNGVDAIAVAAAVWRIGAVNNPVVPIYREHELSFVLDQLRPAAVVTAEEAPGSAARRRVRRRARHPGPPSRCPPRVGRRRRLAVDPRAVPRVAPSRGG